MSQVHAVEKILSTIEGLLTAQNPGYPTNAEGDVMRKNVRPVSEDSLPMINIVQGTDDQLPFTNVTYQDSIVEVTTELLISTTSSNNIETILNELRRQVHKTLMANTQLGLSFVHLIVPAGAKKPEPRGLGNMEVIVQEVAWKVTYRTLISDPSVDA